MDEEKWLPGHPWCPIGHLDLGTSEVKCEKLCGFSALQKACIICFHSFLSVPIKQRQNYYNAYHRG